MVTWILTGSPENVAATRAHGFTVIGLKEGRRSLAEHGKPAFQGQIRRVSETDARLVVERLHAGAGAAAQPG